jgi:REP element-mobilizing transposase RayT
VNGATYFFTVVTYRRKEILCVKENAALIKEAFKQVALKRPFKNVLTKAPKDWEHSTFHRYVKEGIYDINWGETEEEMRFDSNVGNE